MISSQKLMVLSLVFMVAAVSARADEAIVEGAETIKFIRHDETGLSVASQNDSPEEILGHLYDPKFKSVRMTTCFVGQMRRQVEENPDSGALFNADPVISLSAQRDEIYFLFEQQSKKLERVWLVNLERSPKIPEAFLADLCGGKPVVREMTLAARAYIRIQVKIDPARADELLAFAQSDAELVHLRHQELGKMFGALEKLAPRDIAALANTFAGHLGGLLNAYTSCINFPEFGAGDFFIPASRDLEPFMSNGFEHVPMSPRSIAVSVP